MLESDPVSPNQCLRIEVSVVQRYLHIYVTLEQNSRLHLVVAGQGEVHPARDDLRVQQPEVIDRTAEIEGGIRE